MLRLTHPSIPCSAANASFRVGSMRASFEGKGTSDEARSQGRRTERVSNANFDLRVGDRVHLFQYFIRRFECVEASWDAAVNRGVDENFLDLIDGNAVVERTANMKFHFRRAVQRREHGEIDQAPRLPVESGA